MSPFNPKPPVGVGHPPRGWPTIHCNLPDWEKMMAWVHACRVEVNGFGYVDYDPVEHALWLHHPFLIQQEASLAGVETDGAALAQFMDTAVRDGYSLENLRLQWHSHVNGPTRFSLVDTDNMARWPGDMLVSLVLNKKGEYSCRLDVYRPVPLSVELPVQINLPGPSVEDLRQANADIKAFVKDVTPKWERRPMGKPAPGGVNVQGNGSTRKTVVAPAPAPEPPGKIKSFLSWLMGAPDQQTTNGTIKPEEASHKRPPTHRKGPYG